MSIEMVDLGSQYAAIKDEIDAAIQEVIDGSSFIRGEAVTRFEDELADYLGGTRVVGVGSGTDALQIALMAAGVGEGDEIITTPFTFVATAEAAALLGAEPVFVDIDPRTYNLDPDAIEAALTDRTAAIVPVHLYGQPAEMARVTEIAETNDLTVIEDAAQAIGARYRGREAGRIGDVGCFSFYPSKNLGAFGDGGAVVTDDEALFERVKMIANHGGRKKYHNEIVGVNSRLDSIQAAVLRVKLQHLEAYTKRRREAADRYDELLGDLSGLEIPYRAPERRHVFHQYTVRLTGADRSDRDRLTDELGDRGIPHSVYYPRPLHELPVFQKISDRASTFPEAERASRQVLSLPMHTELKPDHQKRIAEILYELIGELDVRPIGAG